MRRTAAVVLLLATVTACGGEAHSDKPAAKPSTTPSADRAGTYITAVLEANLPFTTRHPSNDELLAFPPKWCAGLKEGHSVDSLFDMQGPDLYPYGEDWGLKKADANRLLVIGVKAYCPKFEGQVTSELRASGGY